MALDVFWCGEALGLGFGDVALEVRVGAHLLERRARLRVAEQILREEDDEAGEREMSLGRRQQRTTTNGLR